MTDVPTYIGTLLDVPTYIGTFLDVPTDIGALLSVEYTYRVRRHIYLMCQPIDVFEGKK